MQSVIHSMNEFMIESFSFVSKLQRQGGDPAALETDPRQRRQRRPRGRSPRVSARAAALHHRGELQEGPGQSPGAAQVLPRGPQAFPGQALRHQVRPTFRRQRRLRLEREVREDRTDRVRNREQEESVQIFENVSRG